MSYRKEDPTTIQSMFNSIAPTYDKTNRVLSLAMHKRWNAQLVRQVTQQQTPPLLLDLCCGTGDIAFDFLSRHPSQKAILMDFCENMLYCARQKAQPSYQVTYIQGDVQKLPLADNSIPCATIAYGIRNVKDPAQCFREVYRVLQPGGVFGILELTRPPSRLLQLGHTLYLKTFLPLIGKWLTKNEQAYKYLQNSIQTFVSPKQLSETLSQIGFLPPLQKNLTFGIATILIAKKPQ